MNTKIFTLILSLFCCVVAQAQVKKSASISTNVVSKKKEVRATEKLVEINLLTTKELKDNPKAFMKYYMHGTSTPMIQ